MYAGRVVEEGTLDDIFYDPQHPYTWGLLGSLTRLDQPRPERLPSIPRPAAVADLAAARAVTSGRAARTSSTKCPEVPPLEARLPDSPGHRDRCWLDPDEKREQARGATGVGLGLEAKADGGVAPSRAQWLSRGRRAPRQATSRSRRGFIVDRDGRRRCTRSTTSRFTFARGRRSASWGSPAAASRPCAGRSCASIEPTGRVVRFRGTRHHRPAAARSCDRCAARCR